MKKNKDKIIITSKDQFDKDKPLFNGYAVGHGVHGDTKYNRRKFKEETKKLLRSDSDFP